MSTPQAEPTKGKSEVFCARIDPDLIAYLRAIAARDRRPVAMQLTVILEEYRARHDP